MNTENVLMDTADFFLKREVSLGMFMFCIVVINKQKYCFERKNSILSSQKDSAFCPLLFLGKEYSNRNYV